MSSEPNGAVGKTWIHTVLVLLPGAGLLTGLVFLLPSIAQRFDERNP